MVSEYIEGYLVPKLATFGANDAQIAFAAAEIRSRLRSALSHWHNPPFRSAMLETGMEEASAYDPATADINVRALVVTAIRNSSLEEFGCPRPYYAEFQSNRSPLIADIEMPNVTSQAVSYFDTALKGGGEITIRAEPDVFGLLAQRYPVTWNLLRRAAEMDGGERHVTPIESVRPQLDLGPPQASASGIQHVIRSGIDPTLDDAILRVLHAVQTGATNLVFFPGFKWFTRNTEKLFRVFEFILCSGAQIVTLNYCFGRDSICKRRFLLPPPHFSAEIAVQISDQRGLCKRHRAALACVAPSPQG